MSVPAPRRNIEASDIQLKSNYHRSERSLGYFSDVIALSNALGVPASQREDYVLEMSEQLRPEFLEKTSKQYGTIKSAVEEAEQEIDFDDSRYDHQVINYLIDNVDLDGSMPDRPEAEFYKINNTKVVAVGDSENEWIEFDFH